MANLRAFETRHPGSTAAIEGANEANLWPVAFNGQTEYAAVALQKDHNAAVKAGPVLAHGPAYATTLGDANQKQYARLGDLSGGADDGNAHICPSSAQTPASAPFPLLVADIPRQTPDTPGKPSVITEGVCCTMPGSDAAWTGVNEDVQAKCVLDCLFDAALDGVQATCLYELLDEPPDPGDADREQHFGLFRNGTPKQTATAVRNLAAILNDAGSGLPGAAPAHAPSGVPATGHSLALARSGGVTDITVWAEPGAFEPPAPARRSPRRPAASRCAWERHTAKSGSSTRWLARRRRKTCRMCPPWRCR